MHTKKLKQIREKKTYGGSKLTYENNFTIKKPKKNRNFSNFNVLGSPVSKIRFFSPDLFKFFLCTYHDSILNSSLSARARA